MCAVNISDAQAFESQVFHVPSALPEVRCQNQLLACLSDADWMQWQHRLMRVPLVCGQSLYAPGGEISHVVFPLTAIVALHGSTASGYLSELALVGREGMVGISSFMGGNSSPSDAVVFSAGEGLRMRAQVLLEAFERSVAVRHLMLRYTQALITQMAQTSVCNRHHTVDQAFSRWLLLSLDRAQGAELNMTHEAIAGMLGVRREGVTGAALKLQRLGLIRYARGRIHVLDREGLMGVTCECYGVIKNEYDRLLPMGLAK